MNCLKYSKEMIFRWHNQITDKLLSQPYYYKQWYYCKPCNHVQFNPNDKIINNNYKKYIDVINKPRKPKYQKLNLGIKEPKIKPQVYNKTNYSLSSDNFSSDWITGINYKPNKDNAIPWEIDEV
jgi:hypothetical protein